MVMRRGRQLYSKKYEEAVKLHGEGKSVNEIANQLDVSYSAAYHWVKGLRKPESGNLNEFEEYLKQKGPMPAVEIEKKFQKHNELFLMSSRRGMNIKRKTLPRKYAKYSTWYYVEGQEKMLDSRIEELFSKIKEAREKLRDSLFG